MKFPWSFPSLRKSDEMERYILLKSQRSAYLFLMTALIVWTFWESIQVYRFHTRLNPLPCLLLGCAALIQAVTQLALTRNAVKDDEDSRETGPLLGLVVLILAAGGIAATAAAAVLLMGVPG